LGCARCESETGTPVEGRDRLKTRGKELLSDGCEAIGRYQGEVKKYIAANPFKSMDSVRERRCVGSRLRVDLERSNAGFRDAFRWAKFGSRNARRLRFTLTGRDTKAQQRRGRDQ